MMTNRNCMLLLLSILAGSAGCEEGQKFASEGTKTNRPSNVQISGPDIITVGIPYGYSCTADCSPSCDYTWITDGQTHHGAELEILLHHLVKFKIIKCEARNAGSGESATATKNLTVTDGPVSVKISGPDMMVAGTSSMYSCSAHCYPACTYSWSVDGSETAGQSSDILITAQQWMLTVELICKAWNPVSMLFIEAVKTIQVADGPLSTQIVGPSAVKPGKTYTFVCLSYCIPSCSFTWTAYGNTYYGDKLFLTIQVSEYFEILTCEVQNVLSGNSVTVNQTIPLTDPISIQPPNVLPPTENTVFSLKCVGAGPAAFIQWYKMNSPVLTSSRVTLTTGNTTLTFLPLLRADSGLYRCSVAESGTVTESLPYNLDVNFGPLDAAIEVVGGGPVGSELTLVLGSQVSLQCVAVCHPSCSYTWLLGKQVHQGSLFALNPVTASDEGDLTCLVYNTVTFNFTSVVSTITVVSPDDNSSS